MKIFKHHPDSYIIIENEDNNILIPLDIFLALEPEYSGVPEGFIGREYIQGEENRIFTRKSEEYLDLEWPEGDSYIEKIEEYRELMPSI